MSEFRRDLPIDMGDGRGHGTVYHTVDGRDCLSRQLATAQAELAEARREKRIDEIALSLIAMQPGYLCPKGPGCLDPDGCDICRVRYAHEVAEALAEAQEDSNG